MTRHQTEVSSGGLVLKDTPPKILMVRVKNLKGEIVWTFPKGHLEKGETEALAALREVHEETGWDCKILPRNMKPFARVQYFFKRGNDLIRKHVIWFLMVPAKKSGSKDPREILRTRWGSLRTAAKLIRYPSDKKLLERLQATIE